MQASEQKHAARLPPPQKLRPERPAVPRLIQCACGLLLGTSMAITKLVEWPVVESTPKRAIVL